MIQRETSTAASRTHRSPQGPVRTCVGCRKRALTVELLRVVAVSTENGNGAVIVDRAGNLPGRGAWLHPVAECLHAATRRRAIARALRISGSPDVSGVDEHFEALEDRLAAPGNRTGSEEHEHTVKSR
ncbi:YlxR family protein [[Mycobacterium] kokjensenii]|uniref:YlxR family protein n=1 Tax=[Mycobacterium] kokjensenii TaxID=3064287 RepID=A0ABN9N4H8_9MYCO|nr:YlxR family protein [Mycolicibacter sp. MU0083]CAJ1500297.1 YlxR family protein [Mycolicibacter sp. MU0083]